MPRRFPPPVVQRAARRRTGRVRTLRLLRRPDACAGFPALQRYRQLFSDVEERRLIRHAARLRDRPAEGKAGRGDGGTAGRARDADRTRRRRSRALEKSVRDDLLHAGLFEPEADALMKIWHKGFLRTPASLRFTCCPRHSTTGCCRWRSTPGRLGRRCGWGLPSIPTWRPTQPSAGAWPR